MAETPKSSGWVSPRVVSSTINFIKWDEGDLLSVEFHSGGKYQYQNVTREMFEMFANADSPGMYHAKQIKANPERFPYTEIV